MTFEALQPKALPTETQNNQPLPKNKPHKQKTNFSHR